MIESGEKAAAIWSVASERLCVKSPTLYQNWVSMVIPLSIDGNTLKLGVSSDFLASFIEREYGDLFEEALLDVGGVDYRYIMEAGHDVPVAVTSEAETVDAEDELPLFADADSPQKTVKPRAEAKVSETSAAAKPAAKAAPAIVSSPAAAINSDFTFETFVVGEGNRHSFSAARAVAEKPGRNYNPLFLYGTNGVGKTHLLQAVANEIRRINPKLTVCDISCAEMLDDFYEKMRLNRLNEFRSSFRKVDVLLIDDVHGLAKKPVIQEDFFNIFNSLHRKGKQIILTSDRQPCELSGIDKRLTSRFESGLLSEVCMPEFEARLAMLRLWRSKVLSADPLPDNFLEFLADNISSSVRRLRSAFNTLAYYSSLSGGFELTIELAEELLHEQLMEESAARTVSIESIQEVVADYFKVTVEDLIGSRRTRNLAVPRMFAMSLSRRLTRKSSTEVGEAFNRNHATVLHAEKQVPELCSGDDDLKRAMAQLERQLQKR